MAIVVGGKADCAICGQLIDVAAGEHDGFPHFIQDPDHPLWRFSDNVMHRGCFLAWEHRDSFRQAYDTLWPQLVPHHPRRMLQDGTIVSSA
jgi:hypothetical protein